MEAKPQDTQCLTVSIIVPVYNGENTINECLESLLSLNYPSNCYDIIVVENGSTDRTTEIVQQYPVNLLHSAQRGPAAARNVGINASNSEIVVFTDADCIADRDWLIELVKEYDDPDVGGVGGCIEAYPRQNRNPVELFSDNNSPLINYVSGDNEYLPHLYTANASYRRKLVNQVGGFDPALFSAEDVDLAWRVQLETGYKISYAPKAVIFHQHRTTLKGLSRQYRQYGFGEILLDTMYQNYANYPRTRLFQIKRIVLQAKALVIYIGSIVIRQYRYTRGMIDESARLNPHFMLRIEANNIIGKLEAVVATRFMTTTSFIHRGKVKTETFIEKYY